MKKSELLKHTQKINLGILVLTETLENFSYDVPLPLKNKIQDFLNYIYKNYLPAPHSPFDVEIVERNYFYETIYRKYLE